MSDLMILYDFVLEVKNSQIYYELQPSKVHWRECIPLTILGVPTAQVAVYFADKCGLDLPIFRSVASIIEGEELLEVIDFHFLIIISF